VSGGAVGRETAAGLRDREADRELDRETDREAGRLESREAGREVGREAGSVMDRLRFFDDRGTYETPPRMARRSMGPADGEGSAKPWSDWAANGDGAPYCVAAPKGD